MNEEFELIMIIVNRGYAEDVMEIAHQAGAGGGTILHGRGTGSDEKFFGITIEPEKEVVLTVVKKEVAAKVMLAVSEKAGLCSPGRGLAFAIPVGNVVGTVTTSPEEPS